MSISNLVTVNTHYTRSVNLNETPVQLMLLMHTFQRPEHLEHLLECLMHSMMSYHQERGH